MDSHMVGYETERSEELKPEVDSVTDAHLPEGEKAEHREVKEVRPVADLVEVAHAQASLAVCDCPNVGRIGEEGLVLLHTSAAEERGIVVRPYGFNARKIDAFGKAEVLVLLDQASRDVIGNLLCCSCAFGKHNVIRRKRQSATLEQIFPDMSVGLPQRVSWLLVEG